MASVKRPVFLTIWLSLMTLSYAFSLYSYAFPNELIRSMMTSWMLGVYLIFTVIGIGATIMLWTWKKLGFYIFIGIAVIIAAMNGMIMGVAGVGSSVFALVGIGILYLAMKPVWNEFK
jgi:hypothetical protein